MEFRQLYTFIQAAQLQSFSRAAVQLGYSQSAVTVQIRMLEKELGTRLFDRMGKHGNVPFIYCKELSCKKNGRCDSNITVSSVFF